MAARRCSLHSINYPPDYRAAKCVVCGEPTTYFTNVDQDEDWMDKVAVLLEQQAADEAEPIAIPKVEARVVLRGDGLFVSAWDVYGNTDLRKEVPLRPHSLIQIGAQVFEIIEFVREPMREYLVRPFSTTLSEDDLRRLACPD